MAENKINIVIGADIEKLKQGFQEAVKITGASGERISSAMDATAKQIEKDFDRIASSANTKRAVTQLQNLALKVQALGPEFQGMANKIIRSAGEIKDSVGDVGAQINYFSSDTRRLDAVVSGVQAVAGAFGIAEGAAALLGSENADLQKTMVKVQGAIALLNGLQAVQNVLQQESAAMTGLNALAQRALALQSYATATAMNTFKVALAATGIGIAIVGLTMLAMKMSENSAKAKELAASQKKYGEELQKNVAEAKSQELTILSYLQIVKDTTKTESERAAAMIKLTELGVETSDLNLKNASTLAILQQRTSDYIEVLKTKAVAESFGAEISDKAKKYADAQSAALGLEADAVRRLNAALTQNFGVTQAQDNLNKTRASNTKNVKKVEEELNGVLQRQQLAIESLNKAQSKVNQTKDIVKKEKKTEKNKTPELELKSSTDVVDSEIQKNKENLLKIAKTEEEKVKINFDSEMAILKNKENYLIKSEELKGKEERNAKILKDNLKILGNQRASLESKFSTELSDAKNKDIENEKKRIEATQKIIDDNAKWVDAQGKKEIDAINNYYQLKENAATKDFQNGLLTEKQYNQALLKIQLDRAKNTLQSLKDQGAANTAEIEKQILDIEGKIDAGSVSLMDRNKQFNSSINSALQSIAQSGFENIGKAIGDSINSGSNFMDSAFKIVLNSIAGFIEAYGKAMIAFGVAKMALDASLASMNPALAIAAGVALVATATVVRNIEQGGVTAFANGGIVSGPTLGLMGEYPGASSNPEVIAPLDKLKSLIGGGGDSGGFVAETRFDGRDLFLAVKKYERDSKRG